MTQSSALETLARRMGVLDTYRDLRGLEHITTNDTRAALLRAMGLGVEHDADARHELERLDAAAAERLLDPVAVVHAHAWQLPALPLAAGTEWHAELVLEDGSRHTMQSVASATARPPMSPAPLPLGYHELRLMANDRGRTREARQLLIAAPAQCTSVEQRMGGQRAVGILANLYSVRSAHNWGCGDVGDLRQLAGWTAHAGGSFVGINPLHALCNRGAAVSPYSPLSRLFNNPIYLDVAALPEIADAPDAAALLADAGFAAERDARRAQHLVDYEGVMRLKRRVLLPLHRAFVRLHRGRDTPRGTAYRRYREAQGEPLDRFAVFCALAEHLAGPDGGGAECDWHTWPAAFREPISPTVSEFARANGDAVDFHRYLQFALDAQLADAGDGLALGVYRDLAVGSAPGGCDTWAWPALFAQGASVGAPPDDFAIDGQNWGLPPLAPRALREDRYRYWIRLLRAALAHGGALRIDHVMGLFRQFWVPAGAPAQQGAYVRYPADELLHITALESHRHHAVVVGENLGTVPPEVGPALEAHGILSSAVVYFARGAAGGFVSAAEYPAHALVSIGTHDHVPLAGFLEGRDLEIRWNLGVPGGDDAAGLAAAEHDRTRQALLERLETEGLAPGSTAENADVVQA
ncbi:MAG: 4-alpha-glucanotransferase, partial [Gemmatimonadaceae bacterium]